MLDPPHAGILHWFCNCLVMGIIFVIHSYSCDVRWTLGLPVCRGAMIREEHTFHSICGLSRIDGPLEASLTSPQKFEPAVHS